MSEMRRPSAKVRRQRDRVGYNVQSLSIRRLLELNVLQAAEATAWSLVGAMTIDGRPLLDEPYKTRSESANDNRLAGPTNETYLAAHALLRMGQRDVAFTKGESPDFFAQLNDGSRIGIEVSEIIAPDAAHRQNAIADLNVALKDAIDGEPALWPTNKYLAFNFSPMIDVTPTAADRSALLVELISVLRSKSWSTELNRGLRPARPGSTLDKFGVWIHEGPLPYHARGHVDIFGGATRIVQTSLVEVALARLKAKIETTKHPEYKRTHPLWLVLAITDPYGFFRSTLDDFEAARPVIAPFIRVLLNNGSEQVVIDA